MRKNKGIDIGRIIFACLIPILHIGFSQSAGIDILRQYFSRLGVPFFYAVAGMFLIKSIEKNGTVVALKKYLIRIGRLLLIWLVIYLPILLLREESVTIKELICKTPAYLWYLTGLLVASIPFCLIRNRKVLWMTAAVLYICGTLFGETYKWLVGGVPQYEAVFLTTRNGIFFGLPLMCVGELTWKREKQYVPMFIISGLLLIAEITYVGTKAAPGDDRSMYFFLPMFMYFLVLFFRDWNPNVDTRYFGGISTALYVMQFGIITVGSRLVHLIHLGGTWTQWFIWLLVISIPTAVYLILRKTKYATWLF